MEESKYQSAKEEKKGADFPNPFALQPELESTVDDVSPDDARQIPTNYTETK
jgi:hypothetical protein